MSIIKPFPIGCTTVVSHQEPQLPNATSNQAPILSKAVPIAPDNPCTKTVGNSHTISKAIPAIARIITIVVHHELKNRVEVIEEYADLPFIECYASELNQVFMNILVNAAQAVKGEGKIWIKTTMEDDWVYISFKDTGKGIPPDILKDIFNPFFTTKPVGVGTGLGLSISYGIIEKHGGEISVSSEVGKGTEFIIKLPAKGIPKKNESVV